jgi:GntR family transcriptional regulator
MKSGASPRSTPADFFSRYGKPEMAGVPKYVQLREALSTALRQGEWKAGDRLPTETELVELTALSLGTVQRALRDLVDDGLVVRNQGSGTFVAESRAPIDTPLHLRFLGEAGEPQFLPLYPKLIARTRIVERGAWSGWLAQEDDNVFRIDRKLSVNGEFVVFSRFYFNANTLPELSSCRTSELDGANLKQMIARAFKLPITNVEQRVSFVRFGRDAARYSGVRPGTHGMLLESAASAGRSRPVYFLESFIPPTRRKLDVSSA